MYFNVFQFQMYFNFNILKSWVHNLNEFNWLNEWMYVF